MQVQNKNQCLLSRSWRLLFRMIVSVTTKNEKRLLDSRFRVLTSLTPGTWNGKTTDKIFAIKPGKLRNDWDNA